MTNATFATNDATRLYIIPVNHAQTETGYRYLTLSEVVNTIRQEIIKHNNTASNGVVITSDVFGNTQQYFDDKAGFKGRYIGRITAKVNVFSEYIMLHKHVILRESKNASEYNLDHDLSIDCTVEGFVAETIKRSDNKADKVKWIVATMLHQQAITVEQGLAYESILADNYNEMVEQLELVYDTISDAVMLATSGCKAKTGLDFNDFKYEYSGDLIGYIVTHKPTGERFDFKIDQNVGEKSFLNPDFSFNSNRAELCDVTMGQLHTLTQWVGGDSKVQQILQMHDVIFANDDAREGFLNEFDKHNFIKQSDFHKFYLMAIGEL